VGDELIEQSTESQTEIQPEPQQQDAATTQSAEATAEPHRDERDEHLARLKAENRAHEKRVREVVREMRKGQQRLSDYDATQTEAKIRAGIGSLSEDLDAREWVRRRQYQVDNGIRSAPNEPNLDRDITVDERSQAEAYLRQQGMPAPQHQSVDLSNVSDAATLQAIVDAQVADRIAAAELGRLQQAHEARVAALRAETPDWDTVTRAAVNLPVSQAVIQAIHEMPEGAKVALHLARNPELALELIRMTPVAQIARVGRIAASLDAPTVQSSPKPRPPAQINGRASSLDDSSASAPNFKEYVRRREAEVARRRG